MSPPSPPPPHTHTQFDDLHSGGLYTFEHLHDLGKRKWARMRSYIRLLAEQGLSRDPPRRRAPPREQ